MTTTIGGSYPAVNSDSDATINGLTVGKGGGAVASNTVVGVSALNANTTGDSATALGSQALYSNTTGTGLTAIGRNALYKNTTGYANIAIGGYDSNSGNNGALFNNTTGSANTAVGSGALLSNTTASNNTAVGYTSGYSNTTGAANASFGAYSLYNNTTGGQNTALGATSLYTNSTGSSNTAVGEEALRLNTTASNNTAVGYQAGYTNNADRSVFIGRQAGYSTTGAYNTFVGDQTGYYTTGTNNAFFGFQSGISVTTGAKNTIIGNYGGNQSGLDIRTASNYIVLSDGDGNPRQRTNASGATAWSDNGTWAGGATNTAFEFNFSTTNQDSVQFRNTSASPYGVNFVWTTSPNNTTNYFLNAQDSTNQKCIIFSNGTISNRTGTYNTISDAKLKENIVDATPKLDKLMQVKVRNYNLIGEDLKQIGFVAQELEQIFPALVEDCPDMGRNEDGSYTDLGTITKNVKSSVMIPILVKAIQELKAEVDSLKQQLGK